MFLLPKLLANMDPDAQKVRQFVLAMNILQFMEHTQCEAYGRRIDFFSWGQDEWHKGQY